MEIKVLSLWWLKYTTKLGIYEDAFIVKCNELYRNYIKIITIING